MPALGYFHVIFPLNVRSHFSGSELPQATEKNGNKYHRTCSTNGRIEKCNIRFCVKNLRVGGNVMVGGCANKKDVPVWNGSAYPGMEFHGGLWSTRY